MNRRRMLLLVAMLGWSLPAPAMVADGPAEMRQYVRARLADSGGMPDAAANTYARLLAASPNDQRLALRAYRQGLTAGNFKLAGQAARQLDRLGALPTDATLMLLSDAVVAKDWKAANTVIDRISREEVFAFLVPVMRSWIAFGRGDADPLTPLASAPSSQFAATYARDHRILIAIAKGRPEGFAALRALATTSDPRAMRLRMAGAALLARKGDRAGAAALLEGGATEFVAARALLAAKKPLGGAIDTPALGLSELFAQLAMDVKGDGASPISLLLARQANYLAPDNVAVTIAVADLLASNDYSDAALTLLARTPVESPLNEAVRQERGRILFARGDKTAALENARKTVALPGADAADLVEYGNILSDMDRPAEAAIAYQRAIDLDVEAGQARWTYMFLKARALDSAGEWKAAQSLLKQAIALDPRQPVVLNYLGYGMIEHDEDLKEAQGYIERASTLAPQDAAIADSLGWVYYQQGNTAGAIAALERAVSGEAGQSVMNEHLGDAYWAAGRRIEARYAWRAALVQADKAGIERLNRRLADGLSTGAALSAK